MKTSFVSVALALSAACGVCGLATTVILTFYDVSTATSEPVRATGRTIPYLWHGSTIYVSATLGRLEQWLGTIGGVGLLIAVAIGVATGRIKPTR